MSSYAQTLADSISDGKELLRIEQAFRSGKKSVETTMSHQTLSDLGFVVNSSQRDGTSVSLPVRNNSQYGDR